METRSERFRKYREQILSMPDEFFSPDGTCVKRLSKEELKQAPEFQPASDFEVNYIGEEASLPESIAPAEDGDKEKRLTPYTVYLQQRKKARIAKLVIAGVALVGLALFFILFVGGPQNG
ncbi:MAG: hypothetical protein K6F32_02170 [Bacilli bacterium]|nr:hypothetical protein [Bacilli bacterium]